MEIKINEVEADFVFAITTPDIQESNIVLSGNKVQDLGNYFSTIENKLVFIKKNNPVVENLKIQINNIITLLKDKQKTQKKDNIVLKNDDKKDINSKLSEFNDFIKTIPIDVKGFDIIKEAIEGFENIYYDLVGINVDKQQNTADNGIKLFTTINISINDDIEKTRDIITNETENTPVITNKNHQKMKILNKEKKCKKNKHIDKEERKRQKKIETTFNRYIKLLKKNKYSKEYLIKILFEKYEENGEKKINRYFFKEQYLQNENYKRDLENYFIIPLLEDYINNHDPYMEDEMKVFDFNNMLIRMINEAFEIIENENLKNTTELYDTAIDNFNKTPDIEETNILSRATNN